MLRLALACTAVICTCAGQQAPQRVTDVKLATIEEAWKRREQAIASAHFEWTESKTLAKGSIAATSGSRGAIPPEHTTIDIRARLLVDEGKTKYTTNGSHWIAENKRFEDREYISAFDLASSRGFWPKAGNDYPRGAISEKLESWDADNLYVKPILFACRATHPQLGKLAASQFTLRRDGGVIGTHKCAILSRSPIAGENDAELWVDIERGFLVLRFVESADGRPIVRLDISYQPHAACGWTPEGWETAWLRHNGELKESCKARVIHCSINPEIDPTDFSIEFPPGTWVDDFKTKERYIQRANGEKRLITKEELSRRVTYDELLRTDSGLAGITPSGRFGPALVIVIAIVGCLALGLFIHNRRRARSALG